MAALPAAVPERRAMNLDWQKVLESKRALRQHLAARPIAEKLRLLDALRERELALRSGRPSIPPHADALRERPSRYGPAE
jgi:hypothetical protein